MPGRNPAKIKNQTVLNLDEKSICKGEEEDSTSPTPPYKGGEKGRADF